MINQLSRLFPLWAILLSLLAYFIPEWFIDFKFTIIPLLSLIMFSMGISLTLDDFTRIIKQPKLIVLGLILQFLLMPLYAWGISTVFALTPMLLVGMVLVGSSPGGTASNVITYLAKGDVALSISLTTFSTLLAVIATPYLTLLYVGKTVPIDTLAMLISVAKIVLFPVLLGLLINTFFSQKLTKVKALLPLVAIAAIIYIIAIVVALNTTKLTEIGLLLLLAVMLHNTLGLVSGYGVAYLLGYDKKTCRTLAIEVGMQNSGLAVALASKYFAATAALPGAIFSIWHNLSGSLLAGLWSKTTERPSS